MSDLIRSATGISAAADCLGDAKDMQWHLDNVNKAHLPDSRGNNHWLSHIKISTDGSSALCLRSFDDSIKDKKVLDAFAEALQLYIDLKNQEAEEHLRDSIDFGGAASTSGKGGNGGE